MYPRIFVLFVFLLVVAAPALAVDLPTWMRNAASAGVPTYAKDVPAEVGDPNNVSRLKVSMQIARETNLLYYKRKFTFGGGGTTLFSVKSYPAMKSLFDGFHRASTHAVSLKATVVP